MMKIVVSSVKSTVESGGRTCRRKIIDEGREEDGTKYRALWYA